MANRTDDKIWLNVNPNVSPSVPVPISRRIIVSISLAREDDIKIIGKDFVLREAITT